VLNAVNQVEASKASVRLAGVFRDLAQKQLDAEQKKYELGTSQLFFLLSFGQNVLQAESQLVTESVNYRRNILNLLRMTGELLDERGVVIQ
jgi:outer membrane protein TolC